MRVLVTASTFPGSELDGSVPRFILDLATALADHAQVLVLAPHMPGARRREWLGPVEVHRFRYAWPETRETLAPNMRQQIRSSIWSALQIPAFLVAGTLSLRRLVRQEAVDVVNAHWLVPQGLTAAVARGMPGRDFRIALHVHAGDVYLLSRLPVGRWVARYVVARADRVFAAGSHVRDTLDDLLGRPSGAILRPMGVDASLFGEAAGPPPSESAEFSAGYIVAVGRFVEKKGMVYLIRAFERVRRARANLGLILVGDGPEAGRLQREAASLGVSRAVRFVGARPHEEVARYLRHCRVAAVPSIVDSRGETEGMPTVVLEAMAAGAPVVGSAVDGIPDLIQHGENGWLCGPRDPVDLADKLIEAMDAGRDGPVARSAKRTAEAFRWPAVGRAYYDALVGLTPTSPQ